MLLSIFLMALIVFLPACLKNKEDVQAELTPVSVQLKWLHQAQFAGNYVAKEKGIYEKYGLDVEEFEEFDFEKWPIASVQNREVDFAITGGEELVIAKSQGQASNVKAVAVIFKTNPVCLYSLKSSNITKPVDFVGKTVGIERGADGEDVNVGMMYYAMMNKLGIPLEEVNEITIGYDATELLAGETDVSSGYIINEPHQVIEKGLDVDIILPASYGVNMYADVLIAHTDTIENNPELVEGFVRATLEGWQYAIEDEKEAVDIVMSYAVDSSRSHQEYMLSKAIPLIHTGDSAIGMMEREEWESVNNILLEQNVINKNVNLEDVYTLDFLNKIYKNKNT